MTIDANDRPHEIHSFSWSLLAKVYKALNTTTDGFAELKKMGWRDEQIYNGQAFASDTWQSGACNWAGGNFELASEYLTHGYKVGEMLADFLPGVLMNTREGSAQRSRWVYGDSGDELDLGEALNGNIECFRRVEQSPTLGGLNVRLHVAMTGNTDADIFAQLGAWTARLLSTAQGANISPSLEFVKRNIHIRQNDRRNHAMVIRVKNEGEALDWAAYSALFSPVGYRHFGFAALMLAAAKAPGVGSLTNKVSKLGHPQGASNWGMSFDKPTRTLDIFSPASPDHFPAAAMTQLLTDTGALSDVR
jgi:hypothetical protein